MQAEDQYVLGVADPAWSADELNVRPNRDRGCDVHAIVDFRRILIPRYRLHRQTAREGHLGVIQLRPIGDQTVEMQSSSADTEVVLRSPGHGSGPEKTYFGNLISAYSVEKLPSRGRSKILEPF